MPSARSAASTMLPTTAVMIPAIRARIVMYCERRNMAARRVTNDRPAATGCRTRRRVRLFLTAFTMSTGYPAAVMSSGGMVYPICTGVHSPSLVKIVGRSSTLDAQAPQTPKRKFVAIDVGGWLAVVLKLIWKRYMGLMMGRERAGRR